MLEAAKAMKPCSELNLGGEVGLYWVLFCSEGGDLGFREAARGGFGVGEGMNRQGRGGR